jgi:hypothetical protein
MAVEDSYDFIENWRERGLEDYQSGKIRIRWKKHDETVRGKA